MRAPRIFWIVWLLAVVSLGIAQGSKPAVIKAGDVLTVNVLGVPEFSGDFSVLSDGSISGPGFARVVVSGKTLEDAHRAIITVLRKRMTDPAVNVFFKLQKAEVVYVVNVGGTLGSSAATTGPTTPSLATTPAGGVVPFVPGMDTRMVLSGIPLASSPDQMRITVARGQKVVLDSPLADVLNPLRTEGKFALNADDVVTIDYLPSVRVWATGVVKSPGEFRVVEGTNVYQAIALAGGVDATIPTDDTVIQIRRGPNTIQVPLRPSPDAVAEKLQAGDTIMVLTAPVVKVTVGGQVKLPGEVALKGQPTLESAVARAGGIEKDGTMASIVVVRQGEVYRVDATAVTKGTDTKAFLLQEGDLVYVRRNERVVSVLGQVRQPGVVYLPDEQNLRVSDVLSRAGGVMERGSLRHVFLARAGKDGKVVVREINLDDFVKKGKQDQNPIMQPDDVLLFGFPRNGIVSDLGNLLSPLLLLNSLFRR